MSSSVRARPTSRRGPGSEARSREEEVAGPMTRRGQDRLDYPLRTLRLKDQPLLVPRRGLPVLEAFMAGTT